MLETVVVVILGWSQELLKFGAYDIMNDNGGESLDQDMDIDTILERKAEKRELGDGGVSSFSKAKFCAEVDTEDPDFWKKVCETSSIASIHILSCQHMLTY